MRNGYIWFMLAGFCYTSCEKPDAQAPEIYLLEDTATHYLNQPYVDAGVVVIDNHSCSQDEMLQVYNDVDSSRYGTYSVLYQATDEAGNQSNLVREVPVVLQKTDYYSTFYAATDSCESGNYWYTGLIQDCGCPDPTVIVSNISNFGASAAFLLPIAGTYNEILLMDTSRSGVFFLGQGLMSPGADTLYWEYTISTDSDSDFCKSIWVK